jgi:putative transposase
LAAAPLYKIEEKALEHKRPGRSRMAIPYDHVSRTVFLRLETKANDKVLSRLLEQEGINLSHCKIYDILKSAGLIHMLKDKRKRKTWVRWERKHSLSLWQTDWTLFRGKWLIVFMDDASRLVVGWGLFDNATSENSVNVLKEAISKYGKPKSILTGRDTQFYATTKEGRAQGETYFQRFLHSNGISHILARVNHPQTCGKIERFFGEVKKRIETWRDFATVDEVVQWHNYVKPHMSLSDEKRLVTPAQAFKEKLHHNAKVVMSSCEVV